jgi:hypothetical protein
MTMVDPEEERQRLTKFYAQMSKGELRHIFEDAESLTDLAGKALRLEMERRGMDTYPSKKGTDVAEFRELIVIRQMDLSRALLAKASLESAGIECYLADDNMARMEWSNLVGGVRLSVKPQDAKDALRILGLSEQKASKFRE